MADFQFVGESYTARSIYQDDQESINLYPEIDQRRGPDNRGVVALYPTPGKLLQFQFPDQLEVRGCYVCAGATTSIWVCGTSVYTLSTGLVFANVGTLGTNTGPVSISDNGVGNVMITDGLQRYTYNLNTGQFAVLAGAVFNGTISGTVLTVNSISAGIIGLYQNVTGVGVSAGQQIEEFVTGAGGVGTYTVSMSQSVGPVAMATVDGTFQTTSQVDYVDGFFIYVNPLSNEVGASNPLSPTSQPLSYSTADGSSDNLVTLIVCNREAFLLKERSSEVWADAGGFPFPLARLPGTNTQHGCAAVNSICRLGETFAFLGKDNRGQGYVYSMEGYTPTRVSTYAVETAIASYGVISDARAYSYQQGGHEFYVLSFPSADVTWCFDFTTRMWHKRAWRDSFNVLHRDRGNCGISFANLILIGDWQNGNVYSQSLTTYTDNGAPIVRLRRAPHLTDDLKRVSFYELQIQFQPGVGLAVGQGSNPQACLIWSDDGGSTWSNEHWVSIGMTGKYKNRAIWRRLGGDVRDRVYQVTVTDPVLTVVVSANMVADGDAH